MKWSKEYYDSLNKEIVNCPCCNYDGYSSLLKRDRYGMGVSTVMCNRCGLIHINPRPTELEMANFYKNHYRTFYESIDVPTKEYIDNGPFRDRARFVVDVLKKYIDTSENFIDVGCAEGTLISLIEDEYPSLQTFGIEPSVGFGGYAQENVKGEVYVGTYQEFLRTKPNAKFDLLATTHVLEHILNPIEYLSGIKSLMTEKSILYIEVPNIMDSRVKGIGAVHLGHVLSLDPDTLQILLNRAGFEIIELLTDVLPARTPAMGVICKICEANIPINYPEKEDILAKRAKYLSSIYPEESNQAQVRPNFLKRILDRVFSK